MLALSRRFGEKHVIEDDITVTVLGVKGNRVRMGVDTPADVMVHREAVHRRPLLNHNHTVSISGSAAGQK